MEDSILSSNGLDYGRPSQVLIKNSGKIFSAKMVDCNDTVITGILKAIPKGPVVSTKLCRVVATK